jgi:hypothetical protein
MKDLITKHITNKWFIITLYFLLAIGASIQSLTIGTKTYHEGGKEYNRYNNYTIFKNSFDHLKNKQDLYILYPEEHWDLYKYTPTFSVFFGFFKQLPDWAGLTLWNLLNALILILAIYYIPNLSLREKGFVLLITAIELMISLQNAQSNGLMAGLLVLSFGLLENNKYLLASLLIVFSVYIKLFGIVGFVLFLFYPKKWKLILYSFLWSILLFVIPLIYVNFDQYISLLQSYLHLLTNDHTSSYGYSVMGWLYTWFGLEINKNIVVLTGIIVFLIPLAKFREYQHYLFRYLTLTSILIWVVIFNHKAESPTFIIAITGVSLWYIKSQKNTLNIVIFVLAIILTSLSATDLFPSILRNELVIPYRLKAFPCILIWLKIIYDMIVIKEKKTEIQSAAIHKSP